MLDKVRGTIIDALQADSTVISLVSKRVYPSESNLITDDNFPMIVVGGSIVDQLRGPDAVEVSMVITCAASTRSVADEIFEAAKPVIKDQLISKVFGSKIVKGSLSAVEGGNIISEHDDSLDKWFNQSEWTGKFIEV